ncbi:MAG: alpha/beta hydrolase [Limosilactobacillus gorillae]|nr:alpha/beta hydrolase [Limosilactobacillus gorillae]
MKKTITKKRHWPLVVGVIAFLLVGSFLGAAVYFFNVAMVAGHKSFINNNVRLEKSDPLYTQKRWFKTATKQVWTMESASDHLKLDADYIPAAKKTTKSVLIAHGYMNNKESMGAYAAMFHQLGYNVLIPDARAHGKSQGKYIGYGWPERFDERKWIDRLIEKNGQNSQIVMFGVSMGGATTMMTSGLKLPRQVKAFVEDCGYTSVNAELMHEAKDLYHLPGWVAWPLIKTMSGINRIANGFFIGQASAVNALHHNKRPMLFIHGTKDTFVPTAMVYQNYAATRGAKQLWLVKGAVHAKSFATAPAAYQAHIKDFLAKYVK